MIDKTGRLNVVAETRLVGCAVPPQGSNNLQSLPVRRLAV